MLRNNAERVNTSQQFSNRARLAVPSGSPPRKDTSSTGSINLRDNSVGPSISEGSVQSLAEILAGFRFLADHDIRSQDVAHLREAGHVVVEASRVVNKNRSDDIVLREARERDLILLTCDRDFGYLVFKKGLPPPRAIIFLRRQPERAAELVLYALQNCRLNGHFITVDKTRIRQRAMATKYSLGIRGDSSQLPPPPIPLPEYLRAA